MRSSTLVGVSPAAEVHSSAKRNASLKARVFI